jgi:ketosteroid isomerase-like protein
VDARWRRADPDDEAQAQADRREVRGRDRGAVRGLSGAEESSDPVAAGRRIWTAFNAGDLEAVWALTHPEVVVATDPRWPDGGVHRGIEEFQAFMGRFLEAFEDVRFEELEDPERIGNWGLLRGKWVVHGAASGIESDSLHFSVLFRVRDGLIIESRFFFDDDEALEHARSPT